jgi:hypothetical protein
MELRSAQQGAGMLRSAHARDLVRELAPLHRPIRPVESVLLIP